MIPSLGAEVGYAKVRDLDHVLGIHEQVFRLDVTVDNALMVYCPRLRLRLAG